MNIEDGTGTGNKVGVTNENRIMSSSIASTKEHEVNHLYEQAYSIGASVTPTGAGDCFLYIKNDSETDLVLSEFMLYSASDEFFTFKLGDVGTPSGGTASVPVNRNAGSSNLAEATVQTGVDITGLSGGSPVLSFFKKGGESSERVAPISTFILPKNRIFTGYVTNGGGAVMAGIGVSFHSKVGH